ncbi:hypothetical protein CHCC20343_4692 [Bacillus licheniformis]|nr:hypothetical protein CHCC20343_4692 [Bacillus licheniformis]
MHNHKYGGILLFVAAKRRRKKKRTSKKVLDLISEIGYNIKVALMMIFEN